MLEDVSRFAPQLTPLAWEPEERALISPFFTSLDDPLYAVLLPFPEDAAALAARTSRVSGDLRRIYLKEFVLPNVNPIREEGQSEADWRAASEYAEHLSAWIGFLTAHPMMSVIANPKSRRTNTEVFAGYGDDSVGQPPRVHLVARRLSQLAIKQIEHQRLGIEPIEQSTRFVDYSKRDANGRYQYYTDPRWHDLGFGERFTSAMDGLFDAYVAHIEALVAFYTERHPEVPLSTIKKRALDNARSLLPMATMSQVFFTGNCQALEYLIRRSMAHPLGENRWLARTLHDLLKRIVPSFVWRLEAEDAGEYFTYFGERGRRMQPFVEELFGAKIVTERLEPAVDLLWFDPEGENQAITGMLFDAQRCHEPWESVLAAVRGMTTERKEEIIAENMRGRNNRWKRGPRGLEQAFLRWEILLTTGAWRDLQRNRMHTQQHQQHTACHGYVVPQDIVDAGLEERFRAAVSRAEEVYWAVEASEPALAQYAVTMAHLQRFTQFQNVRQGFWEIPLRTGPQAHPDYKRAEVAKYHLFPFPLLKPYIGVDLEEREFARRGIEEAATKKARRMLTT